MVRLLEELGITCFKPATFNCDNQSAIYIGKNQVLHERMKHIEVDCDFIKDKVMERQLQLSYLPTKNQLADVHTKVLPSGQFRDLLTKLGVDRKDNH